MQIKDKIDVELIQNNVKSANHSAEESSQTKWHEVLFPEFSIMNWAQVSISMSLDIVEPLFSHL